MRAHMYRGEHGAGRTRRSVLMVVLVAVSAVWAPGSPPDVAGAAPAQAGPELTAGPSTGLVDGQEVTVTGTGFAPRRTIDVYQCAAADFLGLVDCDLGTKHQVTAAGDGSVSTRMPVHAVIDSWARRGVDCREPGTCMLATEISFQHVGAAVTVPISFDPGTQEHLPTVTVSPGEGLIDRQTVTVEGQGFVRSERPLVRIYQCAPVPDLGAEMCDINPRQTAELEEEGRFTASLAVSTILHVDGWDQRIDCRTAAAACYLEVVAAGRSQTARTVVRAHLAFDPEAVIPDWPPAQINVTPTTDLDPVHSIAVQGSGFAPGSDVQFLQCRADVAHHPELCFRVFDRAAADPQGAFGSDVVVHEGGSGDDFDFDCRQAPGCVLVVRSHELEQAIPLSFGDPEPGTRYLDPVFDEVDVIRDVVYRETVDAYGNPVELKLDIYQPRGDAAARRPVTMWMHGGFFQGGDKSEMESFAIASARRGQVGVSLQYRLRPEAGGWRDVYLASLDAYDDATAAVEWLRDHADDYRIDPDTIIAGGYSAGAVTALNLAYLPGQRGPATSLVAAAIPDSGLLYTAPERAEPPAIAFHHREDPILPYDNIATLCPQAAQADVPCDLHSFENWGHGTSPNVVFLHSTPFLAEHVLEPRGYFDVTADAAGPYEVEEGSTATLDATASGGDDLSYSWSPADRFDAPDMPTPSIIGLDDGTEALSLTVTSDHGVTGQAETQLTTTNAAPSITDVALPAAATARTVALEASVTDHGRLDTHTATVDWGDGTSGPVTVEQAAGSATVWGRHTYARAGEYDVTLTVVDDDGGTDEWNGTVVIGCTASSAGACQT